MYHGHVVPGFPQHPHRGLRDGDRRAPRATSITRTRSAPRRASAGRRAVAHRGRRIVHAEMFPLSRPTGQPRRALPDLAQPPARRQDGAAHFTMLWADRVPEARRARRRGQETEVTVVAGRLGDAQPPRAAAELVGLARRERRRHLDDRAWSPARRSPCPRRGRARNRMLYFFRGTRSSWASTRRCPQRAVTLHAERPDVALVAGDADVELLVLTGPPHRRARRAARPLRHEHPNEIEQAFARLPAHPLRGLALARPTAPSTRAPRGASPAHTDGRAQRVAPTG
jgi:redox-sensitive bicupin YhaK (pirin superfamily)